MEDDRAQMAGRQIRSGNAETSFAEFRCCSRHDQICTFRRTETDSAGEIRRWYTRTCWQYAGPTPRIPRLRYAPERDVVLQAKFHYAIWFEVCRRPAPNQLRTSFKPTSNQIAQWNLAANLFCIASSRPSLIPPIITDLDHAHMTDHSPND